MGVRARQGAQVNASEMTELQAQSKRTEGGSPRWRAVALPVEHGGWGFLLEPILLGLLIAPSWAGLCLSIAATAIFLVHQPLKIAVKDRRNGRRVPRTALAEAFAAGYLIAAGVSFAAALALSRGSLWLPLLLALPFAGLQAFYDVTGRSREAAAELTGALALGATGSMIALASGWPTVPALALWMLLAARAVTSILYVRDRLRLERGKPHQRGVTLVVHAAALILIGALVAAHLLPWTALAVFVVLLARATYGLSRFRRSLAPKFIGFQELGYGALLIAATALGFRL